MEQQIFAMIGSQDYTCGVITAWRSMDDAFTTAGPPQARDATAGASFLFSIAAGHFVQ